MTASRIRSATRAGASSDPGPGVRAALEMLVSQAVADASKEAGIAFGVEWR